jgi:hypothetical protein
VEEYEGIEGENLISEPFPLDKGVGVPVEKMLNQKLE